MENISNIKLYDLITRWIEVQKMRPDYNDGDPLSVDVMDLTLLLKSMGLKLEYIDFQEEKLSTDTLSVQITCNKSGVLAKLTYDLQNCGCPDKNYKETSFWEVQGTGPSVFSKCTNDTSSNLLPEISEKCSMVSKAMLSNLLDYYRSNIKDIERGEDVLQSPLKVATPKICIITPGKSLISDPCATPPAEGRTAEGPLTPDNRNKFMSVGNGVKPRSLEELQDSPKKPSDEQNDTKLSTSVESVGIDNATRELSGNDAAGKPIIVGETTPEPALSLSKMPDDSSFANSEAMKALITSSPNEKVFDSILNADQNHERDLNVIHCLQQARHQIDTAMLVMKLNNPCSDLSKVSAVTTTPQTIIRNKQLAVKHTERSSIAARRMSLPGRPSDPSKLPASSTPGLVKKKPTIPSHLVKPLAPRGDTPRPTASQLKTVSMLRKTSSSSSVASNSSTSKSVPATITRKPIAGVKPVGSVRPTSNTAGRTVTSVARSVSASRLDKK